MICRPRTPFTTDWYNGMLKMLDKYMPRLQEHPAVYSRESYDRPPAKWCKDEKDPRIKAMPCPTKPTEYPLVWSQFNQIIMPLQVKYIDHVQSGLPPPILSGYA